jgi:hypothetical protein
MPKYPKPLIVRRLLDVINYFCVVITLGHILLTLFYNPLASFNFLPR